MRRVAIISLIVNLLLWALLPRNSAHIGGEATQNISTKQVLIRSSAKFSGIGHDAPKNKMPLRPWDEIESRDYAGLVANLRAVSCPEQTIKDIVVLRVARDFQGRLMSDYFDQSTETRYWRPDPPIREVKFNQSRVHLRAEQDAILLTLFGQSNMQLIAAILGWPEREERLSYLPPGKRQQFNEIEGNYRKKSDEIQYGTNGYANSYVDKRQQAELKDLEKEKRAEIERTLTATELEELDMRESNAARYVRDNLPAAKTEAEYRRMVKAVQDSGMACPQDGQLADGTVLDADARKAAIDARLKEALGEQRAAEQKQEEEARQAAAKQEEERRSEEQFHSELVKTATDAGVSETDANRFFARVQQLKPEFEKLSDAMDKDPNLSAEDKKKMEDTMKSQVEAIGVELMGEKGRDVVKKLMTH
jgi:hypothetical protein